MPLWGNDSVPNGIRTRVSSAVVSARRRRNVLRVSKSAFLVPAAIGLLQMAAACSLFSSLSPSVDDTSTDDASTGNSQMEAAPPLGSTSNDSDPAPGRTDAYAQPGTDAASDVSRDSGGSAPPPMRGPAAAMPGVNYPFPQNRQSKNCVYPTAYRNEDVQSAYAQWKNDLVTSSGAGGFRRVQRLASDPVLQVGSTVSEGIGYGMLIAVYMNDPQLFDDLWKYEQLHLGKCPGNTCPPMQLMDWYISADGSTAMGTGGATDADEDMAFALVMADRQWGGKGSLSKTYLATAIDQITAVWVLEVYQGNLIRPGTWGDDNSVNISYFAPSYYRLFKAVGGTLPMSGGGSWNPNWDATIDTAYNTINSSLTAASGNQNNGLVPAWCTISGVPNPSALQNGNPTNYQYDSCRTPFRIALDWCWNGEPRAKAYVEKTSGFFSAIGARNIVDGYALDGTPKAQNAGKLSAAFIGPAGVGAMNSSSYQSFLDDAYSAVATRTLLAGGAYYEESWTVMSLLMMSANFLDYTMLP
jgi:endo-1,4-beta-D-glucanase Y